MATAGCHRKSEASAGGPSASAVPALPKLVVKDDTAGALFTWVDDKGDFHVGERTSDVPEALRETVRVAIPGSEGTAESVYVVDLRSKGADGTYPVRTMARSAWDEMGAAKRKARLEALAPSAEPSAAPLPAGSAVAPEGQIAAIIYGASWCGPCHQAQALLESLGVKVTKKDIEKTAGAEDEMQSVLREGHREDRRGRGRDAERPSARAPPRRLDPRHRYRRAGLRGLQRRRAAGGRSAAQEFEDVRA
jgi:glutaredoxin